MADGGDAITIRNLMRRFPDDGAIQDFLAGLVDDPTLEERLVLHIEYLERQRMAERRTRDLLRELGGANARRSQGADPGDLEDREAPADAGFPDAPDEVPPSASWEQVG